MCVCILMLWYDLHRFNSLILLSYISLTPCHRHTTIYFGPKVLTAPLCLFTCLQFVCQCLFELHVAIVCRSNIWTAWPIYLLLFRLGLLPNTHTKTRTISTHLTLRINPFIRIQICSVFGRKDKWDFYGKLSLGNTVQHKD